MMTEAMVLERAYLLDVLEQHLRERLANAMNIRVDGPYVRPDDIPMLADITDNGDGTWAYTWRWGVVTAGGDA
jgi:hypothetical protein